MIEREPRDDWHDLQNRVAAILSECGLKPEVAKVVASARGENEIDVYAIDPLATPNTTYFCECKLWKSRVPQAEVHTFVNIVGNAGAHVGLFISSSGFQAGAFEVVQHTNVHLITWDQFQAMFLERWCRRFWVPVFRDGCDRLAGYADPLTNDAA